MLLIATKSYKLEAKMSKAQYAIDVISILFDTMWLEGWLYSEHAIATLELWGPGLSDDRHVISSYGTINSQDVAQHLGSGANRVRFIEKLPINPINIDVNKLYLRVLYTDGTQESVGTLAAPIGQNAGAMLGQFFDLLNQKTSGTLLEVGSRARSRITRRELVPPGWEYAGMDVMAGPNVDVVGDAHEISHLFPTESFDAVMSFSVLEHLLMPWKFIIELNHILKVGATGIFTTHQCWPVHDDPWDFWRFSDKAWTALLNPATGFEIIEASMGEPAFVVAQRAHSVTQFGRSQFGYLASNVMFRKTTTTKLKWPVRLREIVDTHYPEGNL